MEYNFIKGDCTMEKITMDRTSSKTVQEGYDRYIRLKKLANLSEETIRGYGVSFRYFTNFFDASRPCSDITKDTVYDYIEHLQKNTKANATTINTYLKGLRTLLYYFMEEGYTKRFKIELLRVEKPIKETYTEEELEKLLRQPNIKKSDYPISRSRPSGVEFLTAASKLSNKTGCMKRRLKR